MTHIVLDDYSRYKACVDLGEDRGERVIHQGLFNESGAALLTEDDCFRCSGICGIGLVF
jgi:hypothetical protein